MPPPSALPRDAHPSPGGHPSTLPHRGSRVLLGIGEQQNQDWGFTPSSQLMLLYQACQALPGFTLVPCHGQERALCSRSKVVISALLLDVWHTLRAQL